MADTRPDFTPSAELYPFQSRWFDSSVGAVHYIDEGPAGEAADSAPVILFFHGNPTWSFLYRHIVAGLRAEFRCIAIDYPGFGLSVRPPGYGYSPGEHARIVLELVESLGLERYWVMGQDWGGPIGMWVASEHPDRVRGLIFGNTWYWPADSRAAKIFSAVLSSPPLQWAIRRRNLFVRRLMPVGMQRKLTAAEREHYAAVQPLGMREGTAAFPREIRLATPWLTQLQRRVEERMTALPLLLVWGMKDRGFRAKAYLPRWRSRFSNARLVTLPKANHFIQEDAPDEIAAAIREFVAATTTP